MVASGALRLRLPDERELRAVSNESPNPCQAPYSLGALRQPPRDSRSPMTVDQVRYGAERFTSMVSSKMVSMSLRDG